MTVLIGMNDVKELYERYPAETARTPCSSSPRRAAGVRRQAGQAPRSRWGPGHRRDDAQRSAWRLMASFRAAATMPSSSDRSDARPQRRGARQHPQRRAPLGSHRSGRMVEPGGESARRLQPRQRHRRSPPATLPLRQHDDTTGDDGNRQLDLAVGRRTCASAGTRSQRLGRSPATWPATFDCGCAFSAAAGACSGVDDIFVARIVAASASVTRVGDDDRPFAEPPAVDQPQRHAERERAVHAERDAAARRACAASAAPAARRTAWSAWRPGSRASRWGSACGHRGSSVQRARRIAHGPLHQRVERRAGGVGVRVVDDRHQHVAPAAVGQHVAGHAGHVAQRAGLQVRAARRWRASAAACRRAR